MEVTKTYFDQPMRWAEPIAGQNKQQTSPEQNLFFIFRLVFHVLGIATSLAVLGYFIYLATVALNAALVAVIIVVIAISTSELIKHVLL